MKTIKTYSSIFILILSFSLITLQSCKNECKDDIIDYECDTCLVAYKPNIYIYPTEKTQLTVKLEFPKGGKVIKSIPEYADGWNITVNTDGKIDMQYEYLFYESSQPNEWQQNQGWIVKKDSLNDFFTNNLTAYGFKGREIQDFIDYWIPKLSTAESYAIFPQTAKQIENLITLNFSKNPENLLRLFYLIQDSKTIENKEIQKPQIREFKREGFFATEWGVILK